MTVEAILESEVTPPLYRYHLKYANGIGVDMNYLSNMKSLKECDRIIYGDEAASTAEYSSISVGIDLVHEIFWRNRQKPA